MTQRDLTTGILQSSGAIGRMSSFEQPSNAHESDVTSGHGPKERPCQSTSLPKHTLRRCYCLLMEFCAVFHSFVSVACLRLLSGVGSALLESLK